MSAADSVVRLAQLAQLREGDHCPIAGGKIVYLDRQEAEDAAADGTRQYGQEMEAIRCRFSGSHLWQHFHVRTVAKKREARRRARARAKAKRRGLVP